MAVGKRVDAGLRPKRPKMRDFGPRARGCANIMSLSDKVAEQSPNAPAPHFVSAPAPSKHGSPPNVVAKNRQQNTSVAAGRFLEEIYASTLPSWRAGVWRQCLAVVERGSEIVAQ
ncbi:hypothetical protein EDB87DRAFT_1577527 [Lactarius vividus]|nr:hypothetical protein EDB87DRAFT_1577527 [Lactarius vividus]